MKLNDLAVVIPSFNEGGVLSETLSGLAEFPLVVLVDDASTDDTSEIVKSFPNLLYIQHSLNRGQGAALETGFEYLRRNSQIQYIATFDADGQHSVDDLKSMYSQITNKNLRVVLGSRFLGREYAKNSLKQKLLILYAKVFRVLVQIPVTDAHNGLRLFHIDFVRNVHIRTDGFGHADEILRAIKYGGYGFEEHFTNIRYTSYSMKKGQPLINGVNLLFDKIWSVK